MSNNELNQVHEATSNVRVHYQKLLLEASLANTRPEAIRFGNHFSRKAEVFISDLVMQILAFKGYKDLKLLLESHNVSQDIFSAFESLVKIDSIIGRNNWDAEIEKNNKSNLVVGLFPFEAKSEHYPYESALYNSVNCSSLINQDGVGVFVLPNYWKAFKQLDARAKFKGKGLEVTSIIRTPPNFVPASALRPVIILVEPRTISKTFLLDASSYQSVDISFENFLDENESGQISTGTWTNLDEFGGFDMWEAKQRLSSLSAGYANHYQDISLAQVSVDLNLCATGKNFEAKPNAVYLPLIGNGNAVYSLDETTMKHQNYCQIIVDTGKVDPVFLCSFLNSPYGKALLDLSKKEKGGFIPRLSKGQLSHIQISLPNMEMQLRICNFLEKFALLRETILKVEENFATNPVETKMLLPVIEDALNVFNKLGNDDKIKALIRSGESKVLEFKQTFALDIKTSTKESYISDASLKTIAAFLNTDGGDLLVGVDDTGKIIGVDGEISKLFGGSRDKYLLHFKNLFRDQIGEHLYPLVNFKIEIVDNKMIMHVECGRSEKEVFVKDKDFYVRTNPATDKLDGPKQIQYIRKRFG